MLLTHIFSFSSNITNSKSNTFFVVVTRRKQEIESPKILPDLSIGNCITLIIVLMRFSIQLAQNVTNIDPVFNHVYSCIY